MCSVLLAVCHHLNKTARTLSKYFSSNFIFVCKQYFTETRSSFCRLASFHWRQCCTFVTGCFCKNAFWIGIYGRYWHLTKIQNMSFRWNKGIGWRGQWNHVSSADHLVAAGPFPFCFGVDDWRDHWCKQQKKIWCVLPQLAQWNEWGKSTP